MRLSRFFLPSVVWHADHAADCYWRIEGDKIVYSPVRGSTPAMRSAKGSECPASIRRLDEDRKPYELD